MLTLHIGDPERAAREAKSWVADGLLPHGGNRVRVDRQVSLYRGGKEAFELGLPAEYALARLIGTSDGPIGYMLSHLNDAEPQAREILLFNSFDRGGAILTALLPFASSASSPVAVPRKAVLALSVPWRRPVALTDEDALAILTAPSHEQLRDHLAMLQIPIREKSTEVLEHAWAPATLKTRLNYAFGLMQAGCFHSLGEGHQSQSNIWNWPVAEPIFPGLFGKEKEYDPEQPRHRAALRNLLQSLTRHAKIFILSPAQERFLNTQFVPLGYVDSGMALSRGRVEMWQGQTEAGRAVVCSGVVEVAESRLNIVSANGGAVLGEAVYAAGSHRREVGAIDALLWKDLNHAYYSCAEEQRGTAVVVNRGKTWRTK